MALVGWLVRIMLQRDYANFLCTLFIVLFGSDRAKNGNLGSSHARESGECFLIADDNEPMNQRDTHSWLRVHFRSLSVSILFSISFHFHFSSILRLFIQAHCCADDESHTHETDTEREKERNEMK